MTRSDSVARLDKRRIALEMGRASTDGLIVATPPSVRWATGYSLWLDPMLRSWMVGGVGNGRAFPAAAVINRGGEVALVAPVAAGPEALGANADHVILYGAVGGEPGEAAPHAERLPSFGAAVDHAVSRLRLDPIAVAAELRDEAAEWWTATNAQAVRVSADGTWLARRLRAVKTVRERVAHGRAATFTEKALISTLEAAEEGVPITVLRQVFRETVASQGADVDHVVCGGRVPGTDSSHHRLDRHDALQLDVGCILDGVFSDTGTTLLGTSAAPRFAKAFEVARESVEAGAKALLPGCAPSDVVVAMHAVLASAGLQGRLAHGHGIGFEVRELPILVAGQSAAGAGSMALEVGMVVNLEAPIVFPGEGTVFVEKSYVIGEKAAQPLCDQDRSVPWRFA